VTLFRYSALTFNGHRVHYDRDYCRTIEGYPGLVVHGPLVATILADLAVSESDRQLSEFSFRAVSPLFDTAPFTLAGRPTDVGARLWAGTPDGRVAVTAKATFV
jgi:3-methylfumaryl-CoA hydratase